jgi:hypothetical protein
LAGANNHWLWTVDVSKFDRASTGQSLGVVRTAFCRNMRAKAD